MKESSGGDGSSGPTTNGSTKTIHQFRSKLNRLLNERELASRQVEEEQKTLEEAKKKLVSIEEARSIVQQITRTIQESCHRQVSEIASRCLEAIFGEDSYSLKIHFEEKRGKTEARIVLKRGDMELDDPLNECGGGTVDVCAFALRLAALILSWPKKRKLIVADEPFRHLSAEYRPMARRMLESLSKELGIQIIFVTHSHQLQVGKIIQL